MERKNKLLCREWKRWTALVMVIVIILLQPCTVLADAGLRRTETGAGKDDVTESVEDMETDSVETESEEKEEAPINGDSEEISEEELQSETETEVLTEAFTEIEIEDAYDKGIENSVEENLSGIETEEKVTEDMETDSDILLETESETVVYEDNLPLNRISEKTYTVTFYADNVVVDKQTVTEGEAAEEPGAPEKPGYTFQGWNGDYTRVTNSRNVYAKYAVGEFTTHTVTFLDYDGRLAGNRQYVQDGGSAGSPVMPERPGYTFLGWDESRFYIKGDKTLNAQYREGVYKTYMLNYYGYRNNKATEQILKEEIVVEGEDGVPPEPEEVEGYTFAGWDRNILYTNVYRSQNIKALYYKGKYSTHKVEFVDYNGKALMNPQHIPDGESAYSPLKPVQEGHTFIGWDKSRFWIHKDTKLTARYREGEHKTYTLNYYGYRNNKATEQILKEEIVVEGEDGVPPEPEEIEGYTFAGWDRNILYTNVYRNQNIKATYYKGKYRTHKVEFVDYNGKALMNPQHIPDGESAYSPLKPVREGHTFIGWDKSRFWIHKDTKLTARYLEGEHKTYTQNYYGYRNNKTTEQILKEEIVVEGEDGVPPEPEEVEGYTFAGWDRNILYTNVYRNQNVKALYYKGKYRTHKVEFVDYNGKALMNPQHIPDGESAYSPLKPVREGHTFIGWDKSRFWIHKDTKLTARYREGEHKTYTQNYYGYRNNKTTEQILKEEIVVEGEDGVPPEPEEVEGYTFAGWDRNILYTNVYRNQNIKATYYKGKYRTHKVEFVDYNGKALLNPQYIVDGESAYSPLKPVREGHTFIGWDKSRFWIHKDTKLTARYREGEHKTYTLNYYGYRNNKATEQILKEEIVVEGEDGVPPEPEEIEGYTFAGWDRNILYTSVYRSQNIKATYYKGKYRTHKVEFVDYNGKALMNPQHIPDGESAYSPLKPVQEGHTFIGWDKSRFWIHKDTKLTARYREGEHKTYTLNYYGYRNNKATEQILKEEIVVEGEDGVPPEPEEIEGYTFAGWDRNILYTSVYRSQNIKATYYKGKYRTHKVEFVDYNGKALLNPQYVVDGGSAVSPLKPVREGYTFIGWDKENYRISSPLKIQALYKEGIYLTCPVSFYGKITGNPSWQLLKTEYVPVGDDAHPPKLPVNAGYTFREWSGQITGIQTAQNVYAQYNINTETETTYTVRFWCRGEVIKTEEVAIGGNATPPSVPGLKGYSFAGWDKSYVNINPGTRSMAVDITAQYQLTSGIQNAGSVSDLVNALMALGVPVAVKNGFSALGAAIINPFDGIILDVLAATALVGTIIYYWGDIKDLWEDIKVIFRNFAGMDAAGEILDNIEAGVDEAGGSEDITAQLGEIAKGYPVGKCDDAVKAMQEFLIQKKLKGSIIILRWIPSNGYVWSDIANREVGNNGMHQGILYKGKVYCNIHPYGLLKDLWINDFYAPGVKQPVEEIPF